MSWLGRLLKGARPAPFEEFAANLHEALVLDDGPSSDHESHIGFEELGIKLDDLRRFSEKRVMTLEAFLFVAASVATQPQKEGVTAFTMPHPLVVELSKLLKRKWAERGIIVDTAGEVGEKCFDEVELALERPFKWAREWLAEFYDDWDSTGEHYIMWTDQWLKEYETMRRVVEQHV